MENVFENACFGKAYLTRDGRKALYQKDDKLGGLYHHWLITEKDHFACANTGEQNMKMGQSPLDVVSEWRETADEEEADRIACLEADRYCKESNCGHIMPNDWEIAHNCIKIGYLKAIEGTR